MKGSNQFPSFQTTIFQRTSKKGHHTFLDDQDRFNSLCVNISVLLSRCVSLSLSLLEMDNANELRGRNRGSLEERS